MRTSDDPFVLSYCITSGKPTDENSRIWVILIVRAKYSFLQQYFKSSGKPDERPTTSFFLLYPLVSTDPADEHAVNWVIHSVGTEYFVIQQFFKNSGKPAKMLADPFFLSLSSSKRSA